MVRAEAPYRVRALRGNPGAERPISKLPSLRLQRRRAALLQQPGSAAGESLGKGLGFGQRLSLREAQARSGGRLLQPPKSELGRLDEVYAGASPPDSYVFVYGARNGLPPMKETEIGLVLDQSDGDVKTYLVPGDTSGAGLEEVRVNDAPAYWSPSGDSVLLEARGAEKLSGNVLLWERDGQAFKLKADIGKEKAIQIAESVR